MTLACAEGTLTVIAVMPFVLRPTNSRQASTAASACLAIGYGFNPISSKKKRVPASWSNRRREIRTPEMRPAWS